MPQITDIGLFLMPFAIFLKLDRLLSLIVFSLPFTATAVFNLSKSDGTETGILAYHFLFALYIVRSFLSKGIVATLLPSSSPRVVCTYLYGFVFVALLGLFALATRRDVYLIESPLLRSVDEAFPAEFDFQNLTQFLYLLLGCIFAVNVSAVSVDERERNRLILSFYWSCAFVSMWGMYQFVATRLGVPYWEIFNSNRNSSAAGYLQQIGGIDRIASVAVEPSILVQCLCCGLPLAAFLRSRSLISNALFVPSVLLIVIVTLLSTSALGAFGLGVVLFFVALQFSEGPLLKILIAGLFAFLAVTALPTADKILGFGESKFESYSAMERTRSIDNALENFLDYPLLGVGWGEVTSHDLFIRIAANAGIAGLLIFSCLVISALSLRAFVRSNTGSQHIFSSFFVLLLMLFLSGFPFTFGYFWFILALAASEKARRDLR